jgi:hypothetical protein
LNMEDVKVGRKVVYTPFKGCDPKDKEEGVITGKNSRFVFVQYKGDFHSKATKPEDIKYPWEEVKNNDHSSETERVPVTCE